MPSVSIGLDDLAFFQNTNKGNWKIAGGVSSNQKKPRNLESSEGKGILIFESETKSIKKLVTKQEFRDLDLEFDLFLPKGSSFRILLQNKYQVIVSDLWMKPGNEAVKAPGLWQHLSIKFKAPGVDSSGNTLTNARFEKSS